METEMSEKTLTERLWDSDAASALTNEAAREIERLEAKVKELNRIATDRQYMLWAYHSMLGPKALEMVAKWDAKCVNRVHHPWGPEAATMTGEERAELLLKWEEAFERTGRPAKSADF